MTLPFTRQFDARLPGVAAAVRITSLYDAQVFTRRWVIRDKDRNLKSLLRTLERANSAARIEEAMEEFKGVLEAHALLSPRTLALPTISASSVEPEAAATHDKE
ncbi:MAG TPA: hypothetical protein VFI98_07090 [Pseudolabrys sp.]|nr:hypothetical protein [Pseudolabrys sp.]